MKVTDVNGCPIGGTDLDQAITKTAASKDDKHKDNSFSDFDKKQVTTHKIL